MSIFGAYPPILERRLDEVHIGALNGAVIVREFMESDTKVQDGYLAFRHETKHFDPHSIDVDEALRHIRLLHVVIEKLPYMGLRPERLSQQVFELGGCLPPHVDDNATTSQTVATVLMPIAHIGRFTIHDQDRAVVAESRYAPGDLIVINQKPAVVHSAGSEGSHLDTTVGFPQRILWSLDCTRF